MRNWSRFIRLKISLIEPKMEIERALYIVFRAFFEELSKTKTKAKTTPEEGDEGFEGPPCRQFLEEEDASDASKDVRILNMKAEDQNDVESLSAKTESRAEQLAIARAADSVMSDLEKAGTVAEALEDVELKAIIAPESEEDPEDISENGEDPEEASIEKPKARILSKKAEEGRDQEMSSYKTKQLVISLSNKADDATIEVLSEKAEEQNEHYIKIERLGVEDDEETSKTDENDGMMPIYLVAPRCTGHKRQAKAEIKMKDLNNKAENVRFEKAYCEERPTEAPQKAGFRKHRNSSHDGESTRNQRG